MPLEVVACEMPGLLEDVVARRGTEEGVGVVVLLWIEMAGVLGQEMAVDAVEEGGCEAK